MDLVNIFKINVSKKLTHLIIYRAVFYLNSVISITCKNPPNIFKTIRDQEFREHCSKSSEGKGERITSLLLIIVNRVSYYRALDGERYFI